MLVAVVVPMHNEEAAAERCVTEIGAVIAELNGDAVLVVVDDGSTDATAEILDRCRSIVPDLHVVVQERNGGYGAALRAGAAHAGSIGADWVVFMDSDLTNPPGQIRDFVDAIADDVDLIKASRYSPGGAVIGVPVGRRVVSRAGNVVARLLLGGPHRDPTNGFRAFRTNTYLELPLTEPGFSVIVEELYHARRLGLRGADIPTRLTNRASALRPSSFHYSLGQFWSYLRWPLRSLADRLRLTSAAAS
jgi:dolichol-phosphate mannosyltransferase